ncbi:MAG: Ig-like domain-containing protein, partial [Chloroflexia bacterium]
MKGWCPMRRAPVLLLSTLLLGTLLLQTVGIGRLPPLPHRSTPLGSATLPPPTAAASPEVLRWGFGPPFAPVPFDLHTPLYVLFDRPISLAQVAAGFSIFPRQAGSWSAVTERTLAFAPLPGWEPGTSYQALLSGFRGRRSFPFRVEPFVTAQLPREEVFGRAVDEPVRLDFPFPPDRASVEAALSVEPEVPIRLRWEGHTLVLSPTARWDLDTAYIVEIAPSVADSTGWQPLRSPLRFSFTTRPGVLDAAPRGEASWDDPIFIQFDRPTDHASVEAAFRITPPVSGTFGWKENRLLFTPTLGLEEGVSYQVRLERSARAAGGTPLMQRPLEWKFRTRVESYFSFGYGPNVQVLDAAGSRRIQFQGSGRRIRFGLYRLPAERFLAAYSSAIKEEAPIDLEGLERLRLWEQPASGEIVLPADLRPGLYVLTLGKRDVADALIVVLTHYTLILKEAGAGVGSQAVFQVRGALQTIASGEPRAGALVRLYDRAGRLYGEATTDARGFFEATVHGDTTPLLALAEVDGETTVCGFGPEWNPRTGWWEWWWSPGPPAGRNYRVYLYTDRPIYRPGQTVYVRGVVRNDADAVYSVPPAGTLVLLRLRDARDNVLSTRELATGPFGTVHEAFFLAPGGTQGTYHVELVVGEEVTRQALQVEEYRKPDLEVLVTADEEHYIQGEPISLTVSVRYYFDMPAAGAA